MKTFILLCGFPGSGKSTWSKAYIAKHPNTFIVSSDNLRLEIGGAVQNFDHEDEVWDRFHNDIKKYKEEYEDVTVIADATNILNKYRKQYIFENPDFDKKILVIFRKSKEEILKYNSSRDPLTVVPVSAIERMMSMWEEPDEEVKTLYDEIVEIKGDFKRTIFNNQIKLHK